MRSGSDFFGRFESLIEIFGYGGILALVILALTVTIVSLVRGTGLTLFLLFLTYALGGLTYGGIVYMATVARWGLLVLLGISVFKGYTAPRPAMLLIYAYALLGFLFTPLSGVPMYSLQQSVLLLAVVFTVSTGTIGYIDSRQKLETIFKMGIFAAFVWTATSLVFVREYMYTTAQHARFTVGEEMSPVSLTYGGAFFAPMLLWGVVQNREKLWKIASIATLVPFVFLMFLGAVRTAIFGMLIIGSLPLLLMRGNPARTLVIVFFIGILLLGSTFLVFMILPDRAEMLLGRLFESSTTGRFEVWVGGLDWIAQDALLIGRGIGSDALAREHFGHGLHNSYLSIWYNTGSLGLLAVLLFIAIYTRKAMRIIKNSPSRECSDVSKVLLGYLLGIAAVGFFESIIAAPARSGIVMLVMAAAAIDRIESLIAEHQPLGALEYTYLDDLSDPGGLNGGPTELIYE